MFFIADRRESVEELGSDLEEEKWGRVYISPDGTFRRRQGYRATRSPEDSDLIRRQKSDVRCERNPTTLDPTSSQRKQSKVVSLIETIVPTYCGQPDQGDKEQIKSSAGLRDGCCCR
jgi:hypothetical protein